MISIHFDEYALKKHLFTVFISLMLGAIALVLTQGDRIFAGLFDAQQKNLPRENLKIYASETYRFEVSYPEQYLVEEAEDEDAFRAYFTKQQDPPVNLKTSPTIFVTSGDRTHYLNFMQNRRGLEPVSLRNVKVGDSIFAKEVTSRVKDSEGMRLKETVFGQSGLVYVIVQRYDAALDPAYPLLVQTFQFK